MGNPREVLQFWLSEHGRKLWFEKDRAFDAEIAARFGRLVHEAQLGGLSAWRAAPEGALALLLLLDQFARNIHRGSAKAFLGDKLAREIAAEAVARGYDRRFPFPDRIFFYLPFEHGESLADQDRSVALFEDCLREFGDSAALFLDYAHKHRDVIRRFGRFPHRNEALGRETTEAEAEFLKEPGSSF